MDAEQVLPGLWRFADTCNVYVIVREGGAIAVDFGSGAWIQRADELGLPAVRHVLLTHHHADQCEGLEGRLDWPFVIHAPEGERQFLVPEQVAAFWRTRGSGGVPTSYSVLRRGLENVRYDMAAGFGDLFIASERIRFVSTPGHGPHACSVVVDHRGKQIVFCGDAAHAGATIHQPYQLEWDHWTGSGALAAWEGAKRLTDIGMDMLCPSHGPIVTDRPRTMLRTLARKLMAFYESKGSICPGEKDHYVEPRMMDCGARQVLDGFYQFHANGYLLLSQQREALVIDIERSAVDALGALLAELGEPPVTAATATHFHNDHTNGLPLVRQRHGAAIHLHPRVAEPLRAGADIDAPFLPDEPIEPDAMLPDDGVWRWNEFDVHVAPFAGQTWWHCALLTTIANKRVLIGGDNFQPASRWSGTGGYCAYNGSRFREGFVQSAQRVLDWSPDILACGHGTYCRYRAGRFRKIIRWAHRAEAAVQALCPTGDLERDYYLHPTRP